MVAEGLSGRGCEDALWRSLELSPCVGSTTGGETKVLTPFKGPGVPPLFAGHSHLGDHWENSHEPKLLERSLLGRRHQRGSAESSLHICLHLTGTQPPLCHQDNYSVRKSNRKEAFRILAGHNYYFWLYIVNLSTQTCVETGRGHPARVIVSTQTAGSPSLNF